MILDLVDGGWWIVNHVGSLWYGGYDLVEYCVVSDSV